MRILRDSFCETYQCNRFRHDPPVFLVCGLLLRVSVEDLSNVNLAVCVLRDFESQRRCMGSMSDRISSGILDHAC